MPIDGLFHPPLLSPATMLKHLTVLIGIAWVGGGFSHAAGSQSLNTVPSHGSAQRAVLDRFCVTCHNQELRTAGLMLDQMDVEKIGEGSAVWEKVLSKVEAGAMPPAGMPRPDKSTADSLVAWLETELDAAAAAHPNPGRPAIHRLNRVEYTNAVRDLLAVEIDGTSLLPSDDAGYGFDNIGDVLSVSPLLMERYLSAARKITRAAIGDSEARPYLKTYDVHRFLSQEDRMSEALPFGSRGGIAIRHFFPLDGEYLIKLRLKRDFSGNAILGIAEPHHLNILLDGSRIKRFTVGGEPHSDPAEYARIADQGLEIRLPVEAGQQVVGVTFVNHRSMPEGVLRPRLAGIGRDHPMSVGSVTIGGPYDAEGPGETASRRKIFSCMPTLPEEEETCAREIFSALAGRAYRRPVTDQDVQTLLDLYREARSDRGFEAGIGMVLRAILVSPEFLFRIERDPDPVTPGTAYPISDLELASRLSFFLWSSLPDDPLLELAKAGRLSDPRELEKQVERMLGDARSRALVVNFAGQWLYLRNIRSASPDPAAFPSFDENLRQAFQQETELFFESMLREDRSVLDLLDADYTFVNERLARHYQLPNVYGSHFRRVTLNDQERRGLLGQGSLLTVTSYPNRTSPVLRGKWLLENILGTPPPPPPPNVPALKDRGENGEALSVRQRMEQHRANPACASCHARMDPLGFALENFDGIGRWRTTSEADTPIDASGILPDGTRFQGPVGLREVILGQPERFVTTVTERLLTYALGRGVEYYDAPAIRKIRRKAASEDYRWSSLILGIVKSTPFQMRRSQKP